MNTDFGYIDDECEVERPTTVDNLILAHTASSWINSKLEGILYLLETHKHPDLKGLSWSVKDIYGIDHIEVSLYLYHKGYDSTYDEYEDFKFPISWMIDDQLAIDECKRLNDIINEKKVQQRQYQIAQVKASELAMLATLKEKYGQS